MTESNRFENLSLPLASSESVVLPVPISEAEAAEGLFADQGHISPKLPPSQRPHSMGGEPVLQDFMPSSQIEQNLKAGRPASFSPLLPPDPRNRKGERSPSWRGSSKRTK